MCSRIISALFLFAATVLPSLTQAIPLGLQDLLGRHNGYSVTDGTQGTLDYSANTRQLLYVSNGSFRYDSPEGFIGNFTGTLTWQVSVSDDGRVLQPGTMSWFGDVGSGTELLATGIVRRILFDHLSCTDEPDPSEPVEGPFCGWGTPSALLRTSFLHPVLSDLGRNMISLVSVLRPYGPNPPFLESFSCGPNVPGCNYFSDSVVAGLNIPEPDATVLLGLGLLALSLAARARRAA